MFVGVMVGLGVDANAVQLTILAALKITTNNVTKFEMGFDVTFSIIAIITTFSAFLKIIDVSLKFPPDFA